MNNKSKKEQFFICLLIFAATLATLCLSGCGGNKSCETLKYGKIDDKSGSVWGVSIPGIGGICSSGDGCDSILWPQSCKFVKGEMYKDSNASNEDKESDISIMGCDFRYYGDGCLGCGEEEKTSYFGCISIADSENGAGENGCIYGSSDSDEKIISCSHGCQDTYREGYISFYGMEEVVGVN